MFFNSVSNKAKESIINNQKYQECRNIFSDIRFDEFYEFMVDTNYKPTGKIPQRNIPTMYFNENSNNKQYSLINI